MGELAPVIQALLCSHILAAEFCVFVKQSFKERRRHVEKTKSGPIEK
jgi:hypothetical protein